MEQGHMTSVEADSGGSNMRQGVSLMDGCLQHAIHELVEPVALDSISESRGLALRRSFVDDASLCAA